MQITSTDKFLKADETFKAATARRSQPDPGDPAGTAVTSITKRCENASSHGLREVRTTHRVATKATIPLERGPGLGRSAHIFTLKAMRGTAAGVRFSDVAPWSLTVLEQFSDEIRECLERAAEAKAKADATDDPALKADFLSMERTWLILANSAGFSEKLEDFTKAYSGRLPKLGESQPPDPGLARTSPLRDSAEQTQWLAAIVESSDDAIITKNLDGIITSWNKSAERIFGYTVEETIGKSITILIPPGRHDEEPAILDRIRRGERIDHYETIRQRKDGSLIDISLTVSPVKNAQGKIIGASKIARDITERKRSDEKITTLAREAEHRTKNILATVQATVNLSQSDTADGLKQAIEGRIQALANVHTLFVKSRWTGAELSSIAGQELAPYLRQSGPRVLIDGPHLLLTPNTAQAMAVTLHELATNAAKYGSLSVPEGHVEVTWSRAENGRLILRWAESGGPPAEKPTREGFGTRVIGRMIREQLKGEMHLDWRPEGLACEIVLQM